jgi:hypothetical protein
MSLPSLQYLSASIPINSLNCNLRQEIRLIRQNGRPSSASARLMTPGSLVSCYFEPAPAKCCAVLERGRG